jgi:bacterioferritin
MAGSTPRAVAWLVRALTHEWSAAAQFLGQASVARHLGADGYADFSARSARDELEHASRLSDWLARLGVSPVIGSAPGFAIGRTVNEMVRAAVETESRAVALYSAAARDMRADGALAELFADLARDEEAHWRELQSWRQR